LGGESVYEFREHFNWTSSAVKEEKKEKKIGGGGGDFNLKKREGKARNQTKQPRKFEMQ